MKVYIAGRITGKPDYKEQFEAAANELRKQGHLPIHSAGLEQGFSHEEYMRICYAMIDICDAICLLPGWSDSPGARLEHAYAQAKGRVVMHHQTKRDFPKEVAELFNELCTALPRVEKLTEARRKAIRARGKELQAFREVFQAAQRSKFLTGRNDRGWRADFDWILKPANWVKITEGVYENKAPVRAFNDHPQRRYSDAELAHLFVNLDGDDA